LDRDTLAGGKPNRRLGRLTGLVEGNGFRWPHRFLRHGRLPRSQAIHHNRQATWRTHSMDRLKGQSLIGKQTFSGFLE
jgi:hypothetical protein